MFYFVTLAFGFALLKNWKRSVLVLCCGFLPILAFCIFNHNQTGYWFPNSVVVKGTAIHFNENFFRELISIIDYKLIRNRSLYKIGLFPILISLWFLIKDKQMTFDKILKRNFMLVILSLTFILHCLFAETKSLFRYEAYILVGFSIAIFERISREFSFNDFLN